MLCVLSDGRAWRHVLAQGRGSYVDTADRAQVADWNPVGPTLWASWPGTEEGGSQSLHGYESNLRFAHSHGVF